MKKVNSFRCSIKQFWDFQWYTFCSALKASFYASGRNFGNFFSKQYFYSFCFFVLWAKKFRLLSGNIRWFWLRWFLAMPGELLELNFFAIKISICFLNSQQKTSKFWNNCFSHRCQNCFLQSPEKFSRRKSFFHVTIAANSFFQNLKWELSYFRQKKLQSYSEKFHQGWENCILFYRKDSLRK